MPDACCCGASRLPRTTSAVTFRDHWDHFLARWGYRRYSHRVEPGLYALGNPSADSPVFVTANYSLSFDALRSSLGGIDGYIMVLDTRGINVWCAAGKGTFGTDELVARVDATALRDVVSHRTLVLPQLGATGVSAHDVRKRSGFRVKYGPVRARDLPEYLRARRATPEMRRVRFGIAERLALAPIELVSVFLPMLVAAAILLAAFGPTASAAFVASVLAGTVLFPALLPWIPTPNFSTKGLVLGVVAALPFAAAAAGKAAASFGPSHVPATWWWAGRGMVYLLCLSPVTAYLALNFTGSTTFTSKTGVRKEIYKYIPVMAWMLGVGLALRVALAVLRRYS